MLFTKAATLTLQEVRALMIDKIAFSQLDSRDARRLGFEPLTAVQCKLLKLAISRAGFKIPYFTPDGKQSKFFRYRYLEDTRAGFAIAAGTKVQRYTQPKGSPVDVYLPPPMTTSWRTILLDPTQSIVITEGELKAACATKLSIPTIGLGGVWSFQSMKEGTPLITVLDEAEWAGREVYICYDSDGATNPQVVKAESRLAQRLLEKGAIVKICRLQPAPPNEPGENPYKVGIDDYILAHGAEMFSTEILDKAFPYQDSEKLHEMNERVVYVRNPGIIWDHKDQMRRAPEAFTSHAFSNYQYQKVEYTKAGDERFVTKFTAKEWMLWPHRAECNKLAFEPGQDRITEGGDLNTWTGWGPSMGPAEGDISEWDRLMRHVFGTDTGARTYFERWAAWPLQNPGKKMAVAVAIWGTVHGSGKTLVGTTLRHIYGGAHSAELKDSDLEDARFEWAENKQFILADDITSRGDRKFMRKLMTMITQTMIRMNPKFIPSYSLRDTINYMFTSNDPDALFMDDQDRRFFVHQVMSGKFVDSVTYYQWMGNGQGAGIAALWHYLLTLDMGDFDPHAPAPSTSSKESMIEMGKSDLGSFVYELKHNTDHVLGRAKLKGDLFSARQLHAVFDPNGDKRASVNALAREITRAGLQPPGSSSAKLKLSDGQQVRAYAIRNAEFWHTASWREACDHYETNNPQLVAPAVRKKF